MEIPCGYNLTEPHKPIECLDLTENPGVCKDSLSSEKFMSRRKEEERGKQQLESSKNKKSR